jgi:hypothetical protein
MSMNINYQDMTKQACPLHLLVENMPKYVSVKTIQTVCIGHKSLVDEYTTEGLPYT